jgi:DNA-directed RNA polymerase subunit RPC12/RpoP
MKERLLRVAIVGAHQGRVQKVVSLMQNQDENIISLHHDSAWIRVQYLACVATFDSYQNEQGQNVRYLAKVEYCGDQPTSSSGSSLSLAPFFDRDDDDHDHDHDHDTNDSLPTFPGISAVAIGCGIEEHEDVNMIQSFILTLAGENRDNVLVECVAPNAEYTSMKQETQAYKALSQEEKNQMTELRTMGPAKMAKFASSLAKRVPENSIDTPPQSTNDAKDTIVTDSTESLDNEDQKREEPSEEALFFDPNKTCYACKRCRTILFGTDHEQDPPHVPRMHSFSKQQFNQAATCSSLFLQNGLDWMGDISSSVEGRLACPKCSTKIGHWKWAGAQCSCGTWVTPAIQVPFSKVDTIQPLVISNEQEENIVSTGETMKTDLG